MRIVPYPNQVKLTLDEYLGSVMDIWRWGAVGDCKRASDAIVDGDLVTSAGSDFSSSQGKWMSARGAGVDGSGFGARIVDVVSQTIVRLEAAAPTTVSGADILWGTDNSASIQLATDELWNLEGGQFVSDLSGGSLLFPRGNYLIRQPLILQNRVRWYGDNSSTVNITASYDFPENSNVVTIGNPETNPAGVYHTKIESMHINCSHVPGSVGVYSELIQEMSGLFRVQIAEYWKYGLHLKTTGCQNFNISHITTLGSRYSVADNEKCGVFLEGVGSTNHITNLSLGGTDLDDEGATFALAGIRVKSSNVHVSGVHSERSTSAVLFDTGATGTISSVYAHPSVTNAVHLKTSWTSVFDVNSNGAENSLLDEQKGITITDATIAVYVVEGALYPGVFTLSPEQVCKINGVDFGEVPGFGTVLVIRNPKESGVTQATIWEGPSQGIGPIFQVVTSDGTDGQFRLFSGARTLIGPLDIYPRFDLTIGRTSLAATEVRYDESKFGPPVLSLISGIFSPNTLNQAQLKAERYYPIVGITLGSPTVLQVINHGLVGTVAISVSDGNGNWDAANGQWAATVIDEDTLSIPINSTEFGYPPNRMVMYVDATRKQLLSIQSDGGRTLIGKDTEDTEHSIAGDVLVKGPIYPDHTGGPGIRCSTADGPNGYLDGGYGMLALDPSPEGNCWAKTTDWGTLTGWMNIGPSAQFWTALDLDTIGTQYRVNITDLSNSRAVGLTVTPNSHVSQAATPLFSGGGFAVSSVGRTTVKSLGVNATAPTTDGDADVAGALSVGGDTTLSALTATRPLKLNGLKVAISDQIDLNSTDDVKNALPLTHGGTGATSASAARTALDVYAKSDVYTKGEIDTLLAAKSNTGHVHITDSQGSHSHSGAVPADGGHTHTTT